MAPEASKKEKKEGIKKEKKNHHKNNYGTFVGHQEVQCLNDVNKALVLPVLEPFLSPRDGTSGLDGDHLALLLKNQNNEGQKRKKKKKN